MSLLFTTAYAADAASNGTVSTLMQLAPVILVFGVMYFLLIRPQQAKQKKLRQQLSELRRGDKILTAGGIIGVVQATQADSEDLEVEIAQGVRVRVLRRTVSAVLTEKPANDA